jgi:hypothetical protein
VGLLALADAIGGCFAGAGAAAAATLSLGVFAKEGSGIAVLFGNNSFAADTLSAPSFGRAGSVSIGSSSSGGGGTTGGADGGAAALLEALLFVGRKFGRALFGFPEDFILALKDAKRVSL